MRKLMLAILSLGLVSTIGCASTQKDQPKNDSKSANTASPESNTKPKVAWDEFYHRGKLTWSCREVESGKLVPEGQCANEVKSDSVWPDKNVPPDYNGKQY